MEEDEVEVEVVEGAEGAGAPVQMFFERSLSVRATPAACHVVSCLYLVEIDNEEILVRNGAA